MNQNSRSTVVMLCTLAASGLVLGALILRVNGADKPSGVKPPEPATVTRAVKEADLNVVTLTPEALTRLDVRTAKMLREKRARTRTLPGEVIAPPGRSVVVSAPMSGVIHPVDSGALPSTGPTSRAVNKSNLITPGTRVAENAVVFRLMPILTAESRATIATALVDAQSQIKNAQVQRKAMLVALERARQLLREQAGTQRSVDEAQAAFDLADQAANAAEARRDLLAKAAGQGEDGSVSDIVISSPIAGVITAVRAAAGQVVSAGSPLFEVFDPSQLWVKVSASAGEALEIAPGLSAAVSRLGELAKQSINDRVTYRAEPTGAPPTGTAMTSVIDLTFALANPSDKPLIPGERVGVAVSLRGGEEEALVIPWSAIVYDYHGGAWVYEVAGTRQYARRRVDVRYVQNGHAILRSGPNAGSEIVIAGAEELFGREMGYAK